MYQTIRTIVVVLLAVMTIVIMCWAVHEISRINREYKARTKALDEWYEREKDWIETAWQEDVEPETTESEEDKDKKETIENTKMTLDELFNQLNTNGIVISFDKYDLQERFDPFILKDELIITRKGE